MKNYKNLEDYSQIVSEHQLTEIKGGTSIPIDIGMQLAIWSVILKEKLEDWIQSKL